MIAGREGFVNCSLSNNRLSLHSLRTPIDVDTSIDDFSIELHEANYKVIEVLISLLSFYYRSIVQPSLY